MSEQDIRAGGAFIEIGGDNTDLKRKLADSGLDLKKWAEGLRNIGLMAAAAVGVVGAALLGTTKSASEMQITQGKFNSVFKENASGALAWASTFAAAMGRGKQEVMAFMSEFQDLFVPMGFSRSMATQLSEGVTQLATDLASFNPGTTDADAIRDIKSALVGETEAVRKYGVVITEATLNQQLMTMGIQGGTNAANEQQKMIARLAMIVNGNSDAQGAASRTSNTWAAQVRRLIGAFTAFKEAIGSQVINQLQPYVAKLTAIIQAGAEWIKQHPAFIPGLIKLGKTLAIVAAAATALGSAVLALLNPFTYVFGAIFGMVKQLGVDTGINDMVGSFAGAAQAIKGIWKVLMLEMNNMWAILKAGALNVLSEIGMRVNLAFRDLAVGIMRMLSKIEINIPLPGGKSFKFRPITDDQLEQFQNDMNIGKTEDRRTNNQTILRNRTQRMEETDKNNRKIEGIMNKDVKPAWNDFMGGVQKFGDYVRQNMQDLLRRAQGEADAAGGALKLPKIGVTGFFGYQNPLEQLRGMGSNPADRQISEIRRTNTLLQDIRDQMRNSAPTYG